MVRKNFDGHADVFINGIMSGEVSEYDADSDEYLVRFEDGKVHSFAPADVEQVPPIQFWLLTPRYSWIPGAMQG
jgi:hypothetical protein